MQLSNSLVLVAGWDKVCRPRASGRRGRFAQILHLKLHLAVPGRKLGEPRPN
jgi:hypothetical protein